MCGFVGFVDYDNDVEKQKNILIQMNSTLCRRGPDEEGYYINKNVALGHKRLIVIDPKGGKQPMTEKLSFGEYTICYNGQIYNTKELRKVLEENNFTFKRIFRHRSFTKKLYLLWKRSCKSLKWYFCFCYLEH